MQKSSGHTSWLRARKIKKICTNHSRTSQVLFSLWSAVTFNQKLNSVKWYLSQIYPMFFKLSNITPTRFKVQGKQGLKGKNKENSPVTNRFPFVSSYKHGAQAAKYFYCFRNDWIFKFNLAWNNLFPLHLVLPNQDAIFSNVLLHKRSPFLNFDVVECFRLLNQNFQQSLAIFTSAYCFEMCFYMTYFSLD